MIRIARSAIRHPRSAVAIWLALAVALGLVGTQLESRFSPSILVAKGTPSAKAHDLAKGYFGDSQLTPIMLSGPAKQIDQQGTTLVAHLRARGDTAVLSPFDDTPGTEVLRPRPTEATIIASIERSEEYVIDTALPQIHQAVDTLIKDGVTANVTGQASIDSAVRDESLRQTKLAVAIAIPVVFLVLLLVLRAPLAAFIVTGFAATMLPVGYGLTALAANIIPVDAVAASGAAMVGLALGVGFGLLMVSRFREQLASSVSDPAASAHAAAEAATGAGRAVLIAGTALVVAMVLASLLSMPEILNSIGIGATIMAAVGAAGAVGALPAMLTITGPHVEAASFGPKIGSPKAPLAHRLAALPAIVAGVALAGMVALSIPVLDMKAGPPGPKMLPKDNPARLDYEAVAKSMGEGWLNPFEIIVAKGGKPITTQSYLGQLERYQKALGKDKQVESVMGPGMLFANANELQGIPNGLNKAAATATKSKKDLKKLIAGLKLATDGVAQLRGGLGAAANGAGQLQGGTGQAYGGSGQLASGLSQADAGAQQLKAGAAAAAAGAKELAGGLELAKTGVTGGLPAIDNLVKSASANAAAVAALGDSVAATTTQISNAAAALGNMTTGKTDPAYDVAVGAVQSAAATNAKLADQVVAAANTAQANATVLAVVKSQVQELEAGIGKLLNGSNQLSAGLAKLSAGNGQLADGIAQLDAGGAKLQNGLAQLNAGAGQLAAGLSSGIGPSGQLLAGMNTITGAVVESRKKIPSTAALEKLKQEAPGLFDSGYFVMAALDGAPKASRDAASFVVNVDNGGTAGRITVVPKTGAQTPATEALYDRLQASAAVFATATRSEAAVGGTGASLIDYKNTGLDKLPIVIGALALLTFVVLAIETRSVLVPATSVVLSALTATASFGVLWMLFGGSDPVLGGSGAIDPVTMIAVSTVIFGLTIQYEVFAVEHLHRVYGAGAAMLGVLLAFIPAELTLISEFAIGMAVAVILDTLVVRPVMVRLDRRRRPPEGPPVPGARMPEPHLHVPHVHLRRPHMPHALTRRH